MIKYTNLKDINSLQEDIVRFIDYWVHEEKTPIPRREIIDRLVQNGNKKPTIIHSINVLLDKGYIRRGIGTSNKTYYVQLRRI